MSLLLIGRLIPQVDKETNTDEALPGALAVRPKDRGGMASRQRPFVRNSMIMRSQTFSPGERNQYICRVSLSQDPASPNHRLSDESVRGAYTLPLSIVGRNLCALFHIFTDKHNSVHLDALALFHQNAYTSAWMWIGLGILGEHFRLNHT